MIDVKYKNTVFVSRAMALGSMLFFLCVPGTATTTTTTAMHMATTANFHDLSKPAPPRYSYTQ